MVVLQTDVLDEVEVELEHLVTVVLDEMVNNHLYLEPPRTILEVDEVDDQLDEEVVVDVDDEETDDQILFDAQQHIMDEVEVEVEVEEVEPQKFDEIDVNE